MLLFPHLNLMSLRSNSLNSACALSSSLAMAWCSLFTTLKLWDGRQGRAWVCLFPTATWAGSRLRNRQPRCCLQVQATSPTAGPVAPAYRSSCCFSTTSYSWNFSFSCASRSSSFSRLPSILATFFCRVRSMAGA